MKKLGIIVLCALLSVSMLVLPSCGRKEELPNEVGAYVVEIVSCRKTTSLVSSAVVIKYKFTNNSTIEKSFATAIKDSVYQDGVKLSHDLLVQVENGKNNAIKPGATVVVEVAYSLENNGRTIEVEVKERALLFGSKKVITRTFTI